MCLNLIYLITTKFTQDLVCYHRLNLKIIIEKSLISEGFFECEIKQSVIGIRSRVGEGTVKNCYVMGNDFYQSINDMNADIKIINS
jgi:ADP-glucose pyrophosphorylase